MKKYLPFLFISIMLILCFVSYAESMDLESLSFEELCALKQSVEDEYNRRIQYESESFVAVTKDLLIVGKDLMAGTYYISVTAPYDNGDPARVFIWTSEEAYRASKEKYPSIITDYETKYYLYVSQQTKITLKEGQVILIDPGYVRFSLRELKDDELYQFILHEGTHVDPGVYVVGEHIPSGVYQLYPASPTGSIIYYYKNLTDLGNDNSGFKAVKTIYVKVVPGNSPSSITLFDGDAIRIEGDVIFKKPAMITIN